MPIHFPTGEPKVRRIKVLAISADAALELYGVAITDSKTLQVDMNATAALRSIHSR